MPAPLKLEFQITLNDWLEFRRREQSNFRLWLLRIADVLWVPMWVLFAVSILLIVPPLSSFLNISLPAWLPIPILSLLAASHVYRSSPANSATLKATKEWKQAIANVGCKVELTENGFQYRAGTLTHNPTWAEVGSVFQSEHLLIFCDQADEYSLLIPKRSFTSEEELRDFLEIAYQKTCGSNDR